MYKTTNNILSKHLPVVISGGGNFSPKKLKHTLHKAALRVSRRAMLPCCVYLSLLLAPAMLTGCSADNPEETPDTRPNAAGLDTAKGELRTRIDAFAYPPIGGRGAAEIVETEEHDYHIAFGCSGEFSIILQASRTDNADGWFAINDANNIAGAPTITVEDPDGQFVAAPQILPNGEIFGKMRDRKGITSCITVSVEVTTGTSPQTTETLSRRIFITQE